jgi:hypothetical protein
MQSTRYIPNAFFWTLLLLIIAVVVVAVVLFFTRGRKCYCSKEKLKLPGVFKGLEGRAKKALEVAFSGPKLNIQSCPLHPSCALTVSDVPFPGLRAKKYSPEAALFFLDLLIRFTLMEPVHGGYPLHLPVGWTLIKTLKYAGKPDCYILWNEPSLSVIIAFKGVVERSQEVKMFELLSYATEKRSQEVLHGVADPNVKVDGEMLREYEVVQEGIWEAIPERAAQVYICGHSLGASLTVITALDIGTKPGWRTKPVIGYGFASPRSVSPQTNDWLARYGKNITIQHTINLADLISWWPPPILPNFVHPDDALMYIHGGTVYVEEINWGSVYANHLEPCYKFILEKWIREGKYC